MKYIFPYRLFESAAPERKVEYWPEGKVKYEMWYLDDIPHREDGPATLMYRKDGSIEYEAWYLNGKRHREDGPASIQYYSNGQVEYETWKRNGNFHRDGGPARIWYYDNGRVQIEGWYQNAKIHREDGPAWIDYDENGQIVQEHWFLNDFELSQKEAEAWNKNTPATRLVQLGNDPDPKVRDTARENPNYPEDLPGWAINLNDWS